MFLPGEFQGWGSLVGCRLWGHTESDTTEATLQQQQQQTTLNHKKVMTSKLSETIIAQIQQPHKEHMQEGRKEGRKVGGREEGTDQSHLQCQNITGRKNTGILIITVAIQQIHVI